MNAFVGAFRHLAHRDRRASLLTRTGFQTRAARPTSMVAHRHRGGEMASGWAADGAVQDQIDDTVKDEVMRARARMPTGAGEAHCVECGDEIPARRRQALPGVRTCIVCQSAHDSRPTTIGFYRRGSKDSQLK